MVELYGYIKKESFVIGDDLAKVHIGTYTRAKATQILNDRDFIKAWNDNHISELIKISFEITNEEI